MRKFRLIASLNQVLKLVFFIALFLAIEVIATHLICTYVWKNRYYPKTYFASVDVGNKSYEAALALLSTYGAGYVNLPITLQYEDREWKIHPQDIELSYHFDEILDPPLTQGRANPLINLKNLVWSLTSGVNLPLQYSLNQESLEASVSAVTQENEIPPISPYVEASDSGVIIHEGEVGQSVDLIDLYQKIDKQLLYLAAKPIKLQVKQVEPGILIKDTDSVKKRAEKLLEKKVVLFYKEDEYFEKNIWELSGKDLISFIAFEEGFDTEKIASYSAILAESINRPAQNAKFVYRNGKVEEFSPAKKGSVLDIKETISNLVREFTEFEQAEQSELEIEIFPTRIAPDVTISEVNSLGINQLLGRGKSTYKGSIENRKYNIALAAQKISGSLIPPGNTFSFNDAMGDISTETGYKQSYIIKDGKTILGDGGGVCQVSSTVFRAALNAGLPITERRAHSYRVSYYEQGEKPGLDATVFAPSVDLKFVNDTSKHILIQTEVDKEQSGLVVDIYGSADGRKATIINYKLWDVAPPPPDLFWDDPALPEGSIKQIDWKAWGAKVKYDYVVEKDGEIIYEKTFYNVFQPWQSVFLRGVLNQ